MEGSWVNCQHCGKKLLKRKPNGIFVFKFGKIERDGKEEDRVEMEIHGSIRMRCLRKSCREMNLINYFPGSPQ
jgi:hypothetical protein